MVDRSDTGIKHICNKNVCTGCSACFGVCPTKSISMKMDEFGEFHPWINSSTCLLCGKCDRVCPSQNDIPAFMPEQCFAVWRNDIDKRQNSSSGGFAAVLAEAYINNGGCVYGVIYERGRGVFYRKATTLKEVEQFKGSKYVQADILPVYRGIVEDINSRKPILVVGTPCHIAGLRSFLSTTIPEYNKYVLLVDFLCHGTVPEKYLQEEIDDICTHFNVECDSIRFRSNNQKTNYRLTLSNSGKDFYCVEAERQRYFYGFLHSIIHRESCISCKRKTVYRHGDLTIGDFIGLGKTEKINVPEGVNPSLLLVNTEIGNKVLSTLSNSQYTLIRRNVQEAISGGPSLRGGADVSTKREIFRKKYLSKGYIQAANESYVLEMKFNFYRELFRQYLLIVIRKIKRGWGR